MASALLGCVLLFACACGGGGGNGGNGGNGSSTGEMSMTTGSSTSASSASSSSGGQSLCEQFCAAETAKGCGFGSACLTQCQHGAGPAGACASEQDALLLCRINASKCPPDYPECNSAASAYASCVFPGSSTCSQDCYLLLDSGECHCDAVCSGVSLKSECAPGNGTRVCTCLKDDAEVGSCTEAVVAGESCSFLGGCCLEVFFPSP